MFEVIYCFIGQIENHHSGFHKKYTDLIKDLTSNIQKMSHTEQRE